ncbi:MAG: Smr/MutS family protein [Bacteroidia bacterium]|nr:Smr/MutS family protein [Bacteroidia bacterium]
MLKLGDKVRFVNEKMEGIVTSIKDKNQVGVTVDNDFEIPVLINEVVKIKFDEKPSGLSEPTEEKPIRIRNNNPLGVFLAFERYAESNLQLYVHNNFADDLMLVIYQKEQGVFKLTHKLILERDETKPLLRFDLNNFDKWAPLYMQMLSVEQTTIKPVEPISYMLNFHPKAFHLSWKHCFFLNKQAYMFRVDEKLEKLDLEKLKSIDFAGKFLVQPIDFKARPANIIDLHYESLVNNGYGASNDITGMQMEVFAKTLESAYVHKMKSIVFIHGVGNMYLKNKIRTSLSKQTDTVEAFEDADILKYGGGATLVILK